MKIDLSTHNWTLCDSENKYECAATVPGCNYTALLSAGLIPDPMLDQNAEQLTWVSQKEWIYSVTFEVTPDFADKNHIHLKINRIDPLANIYVNDSLLAITESVHLTYDLPVKDYLHVGENTLTIKFAPPYDKIKKMAEQYNIPNFSPAIKGAVYVRKPIYQFGWDFAPYLAPVGLGDEVYIYTFDNNKIDHISVRQKHIKNNVYLKIHNYVYDPDFPYTFEYVLTDPNGNKQIFLSGEERVEYAVENPMLWWCNGMGEQPLYKLECRMLERGALIDSREIDIGLRNLSPFYTANAHGNNFCFKLNGYKLFAKGANWVPFDYFNVGNNATALEQQIIAAKKANFNMFRVWGGAYFGSDLFYSLCDRYGIMVWQDLPFACSAYPFDDEEFLNITLREIKENVRRIKNHACLALFCGNNEIESMSDAWMYRKNLLQSTRRFFYEDVPDVLQSEGMYHLYIPTSPVGSDYRKDVHSFVIGDSHIWNVWHGMRKPSFYLKQTPLFCSEFGLMSLPTLNGIDDMSSQKDVDISFDSPLITTRQRSKFGMDRLRYYILERFWKPTSFEDYVTLSHLAQAEAIEQAVGHWRLNNKKCFGALYWQYNDCWNAPSWSGIDHSQNFKALQYRAAHFFSPDALVIKRQGRFVIVYLIIDALIDQDVYMQLYVGHTDSEKCTKIVSGLSHERRQNVTEIARFDLHKEGAKNFYVHAKLTVDMKLTNSVTLIPQGERRAKLKPNGITYDFSEADGYAFITLYSTWFTRFVIMRLKGKNQPFSDNYFDMTPGETKLISIPLNGMTLDEVKQCFSVTSLNDVPKKGNALTLAIAKARILSKPYLLGDNILRRFQ